MSVVWIVGAAILFMIFIWWILQPKQGQRAANAPHVQQKCQPPLSPNAGNPSHPSWPSLNAEAQDLLIKGHKILAIKLIREQTGWSLKQAKQYAEDLTHPVSELDTVSQTSTSPMPLAQNLSVDRDAEVRQLVLNGQKIVAIKRVREQTGWGLRESKDYVETLLLTEEKP
ncbi:50S ribosomal protein L7/L12 [Acaryochloris thomasi RCC1774]|uniref:50S ribosomal protein L7/L12 n=1 Tax=Acaryochloris thomasi RCC1774 TaxID=1764569 RepID=A0A2W1JIG0_9CYAN|nr:hypothetical protein [Acaryochloris thomasi]PZD73086.1 50S ribosomal protein L7/L12 [Acaryochloris thomasi RCC1774]